MVGNQIGESPTQNGWNDLFKAIAVMMTNMFKLNNVPASDGFEDAMMMI